MWFIFYFCFNRKYSILFFVGFKDGASVFIGSITTNLGAQITFLENLNLELKRSEIPAVLSIFLWLKSYITHLKPADLEGIYIYIYIYIKI